MGRKKRPYYRIVAVDSRKKRDGAFIDRLGYYHPLDTPTGLAIDADKALKWLRTGAIPSDTVLSLLKKEGVWLRFRLEKRGLPEGQIDTMMGAWFVKHHKAPPVVASATEVVPAPEAVEAAPAEPVIEAATAEPVVEAAPVEPVVEAVVAEPEVAPSEGEPSAE